jgi:hypothetical protein
MPTPKALHSKATPKWGTPTQIIELARKLLGEIQLDPASSEDFNQLVKALVYYTEQDNGLVQPWGGTVFLNPPGGLVREFWEKLCKGIASGEIEKAFWVGFSVEQLCTLADCEYHPYDFSHCVLRKRLSFNNEELVSSGAPSHGNYVVGLGVDHEYFTKLFGALGKISRGILAV